MKKTIILAAVLGFAAVQTASADPAQDNWTKLCAKCHGADGKGQTAIGKKLGAKDYSDPQVQAAVTDADAIKSIKEGLKSKDGVVQMKPYPALSDADVQALVAYMRTLKK
ncbi:MAG TPA: cytochrome c [Candidatus Methylacidiphilales bacterium]